MTASLIQINDLIERFRKEAIGQPELVAKSGAFEYRDQSLKVVAVLKLVRAAQSLGAIWALAENGFLVDFGAIIRCLNDCIEDVYFLLETYPDEPSGNVRKFEKGFFEHTADGIEHVETAAVPRDKIRSAFVRILKQTHDDATQKRLERIYNTFCGYIHTNYAHIMEVYNGTEDSFNLGGVPSEVEIRKRLQFMEPLSESVLLCAAFAATKFGLGETAAEIMKALD